VQSGRTYLFRCANQRRAVSLCQTVECKEKEEEKEEEEEENKLLSVEDSSADTEERRLDRVAAFKQIH